MTLGETRKVLFLERPILQRIVIRIEFSDNSALDKLFAGASC
jgi:hypothetical protein